MDKLTEAHLNVCKTAILRRGMTEMSADHANITREYMGRFAEWAVNEGWGMIGDKWVTYQEKGSVEITTSELIELFEKENV